MGTYRPKGPTVRPVEHIVPGNNFEEFPYKRLMTNQQRNIVKNHATLQFLKLLPINNIFYYG